MTSRPPPPPFEGCTLDGVRYDADYATTGGDPGMRSGGIAAIDALTGERLWTLVLWTSPRELMGGLIVPPRYLHRTTAASLPGRLRVVDEHGFAWVVDLASRTARALGRPVPADAPGMLALPARHASRIGRPSPAPISFEGRRYEQILNGDREGLGQRTGLMSVTDEATSERLDVVRLYDYPRRDGLEDDAGDVFFVSARLDPSAREIVVESERHERFACRIDDRSVRRLA